MQNLAYQLGQMRGVLYGLKGKFEECVPLFKKAIAIWEKTGGPLLATGYNNLGRVYQQQVL